MAFHVVVQGIGAACAVGAEMVDEIAFHVVHFHVDFAAHFLETERHLSVVGIGNDAEVGKVMFLFLDAVERADEPIALRLALLGASVVDRGVYPNGVRDVVQYINLAGSACGGGGGVGFKQPLDIGVFEAPTDGIPTASERMPLLVDAEFVGVDLELGGRHDPVGEFVIGVSGVNDGGVGRVIQIEMHGDGAVAALHVGEGVLIGAFGVVNLASPFVAVADFIGGNVELGFLHRIDSEVQVNNAVAVVLRLQRVVVSACYTEVLSKEVVGFAGANLSVGV